MSEWNPEQPKSNLEEPTFEELAAVYALLRRKTPEQLIYLGEWLGESAKHLTEIDAAVSFVGHFFPEDFDTDQLNDVPAAE